MLAPKGFFRYSDTAPRVLYWARKGALQDFDWHMGRCETDPDFGSCARSKVDAMDTRTLLILGLGIAILLLLGFCALPS